MSMSSTTLIEALRSDLTNIGMSCSRPTANMKTTTPTEATSESGRIESAGKRNAMYLGVAKPSTDGPRMTPAISSETTFGSLTRFSNVSVTGA